MSLYIFWAILTIDIYIYIRNIWPDQELSMSRVKMLVGDEIFLNHLRTSVTDSVRFWTGSVSDLSTQTESGSYLVKYNSQF
jgi:hypothetical protein